MKFSVADYYDYLVTDNNDPVHDSSSLRDYMDKWDGQIFIDKLGLDFTKNTLEIGVGTGRLAIRIAPYCRELFGIDISPKTIDRAKINLNNYSNVKLFCGDFLEYGFVNKFDIIYSSLTFMHISEKQVAVNKAAELLNENGRFILSIDKNQNKNIKYGEVDIEIYPDTVPNTESIIKNSGLKIIEIFETEFAHIFVAEK